MSVSIPCAPVAPSTKVKYTVSLPELLAEAVTFVAVVAVSALPVTSPVTAPSSVPTTSVAAAYPVPPVLTVVVGSACKSLKSLYFPLSLASRKRPE